MTEIEKMYENANIKPKKEGYCDWDSDCPYPDIINNGCEDECSYWKYKDEANYPPFTSDKQLELIKWLAIRFNSDYMSYWHNEIKDVWIFRLHDLTELSSEEPFVYEGRNKDFTESLCNLINALWQSLTDQEKEKIRRTLNE